MGKSKHSPNKHHSLGNLQEVEGSSEMSAHGNDKVSGETPGDGLQEWSRF